MEDFEALKEGKDDWKHFRDPYQNTKEAPPERKAIVKNPTATPATDRKTPSSTPETQTTSTNTNEKLVDSLFSYVQRLNANAPILKYFETVFTRKANAPENFLGLKEYSNMVKVLEKFMQFCHDNNFQDPRYEQYRRTLVKLISEYEEFIESKLGLNKDLDDNIKKLYIIIDKLKMRLIHERNRSN